MSESRLYGELAGWWPVISPPAEYRDEARIFAEILERHARRRVRRVLELGSGGGHLASHLARRYRLTLLDASPAMLAVSRRLNPACEHVAGDMRDARLGRLFDGVILADAVMYMRSERDLAAAARTAAAHLAPGGAALLVPDFTRESFRPGTEWGGGDDGTRAARYVEWIRPAARGARAYAVSYVFLLAERGEPVRIEHEEHVFGLFPRATWLRVLERTGLRARAVTYPTTLSPGPRRTAFVGVKPLRPARPAGRGQRGAAEPAR